MLIATPTAAPASIASGRASSPGDAQEWCDDAQRQHCSILRQLIHAQLRIGATFGARVVD
jgi:hypothetical protein